MTNNSKSNELEKEIAVIDAYYEPKLDELHQDWSRDTNAAVAYWNAKGVYVKTDPRSHEALSSRGGSDE